MKKIIKICLLFLTFSINAGRSGVIIESTGYENRYNRKIPKRPKKFKVKNPFTSHCMLTGTLVGLGSFLLYYQAIQSGLFQIEGSSEFVQGVHY